MQQGFISPGFFRLLSLCDVEKTYIIFWGGYGMEKKRKSSIRQISGGYPTEHRLLGGGTFSCTSIFTKFEIRLCSLLAQHNTYRQANKIITPASSWQEALDQDRIRFSAVLIYQQKREQGSFYSKQKKEEKNFLILDL